MNNRNPNKENTFTNLGAWCARYHKESGLKIHPSSVPVDLILEDILGYIAVLISHDKGITGAFDAMNERVKTLESRIGDLECLLHEFAEEFKTIAQSLTKKEIEEPIEERFVPLEVDKKSGLVKSVGTPKVKK